MGSSERRLVHVAGPGPRAARRVNDKLWFWALAREVAGRASVPPTFIAFGPAAAASQVARLAEASEQVVVKVPDSAGAAGNIRIDGKRLRGMRLSRIRDILLRRLAAVGWTGTYPVLVGVWESGVLSSPSAQMWLPQVGEGPPRLLGIFEQRIEAGEGHFVGATRAHFDRDVETAIAEEATRIGAVLQRLGYYGACSLDAVLRLAKSGRRELHWIECNGRWGGVSIPLAAGREILGGTDPKGIVIVQDILPASTAMDIETISNLLSDLLFRRGVTQDGIVILSPPQSTNGVLLNAMALSHSQARAGELMSLAHKRLGRWP